MNEYTSSAESGATGLDVIQAAGGLIWRDTPRGREICIIYRSRYKDWTLPKGKLISGEKWHEAALREVHEEIGSEVVIKDFAGCTAYTVAGNPKVVLFWNMVIVSESEFKPTKEIELLEWVSPSIAHQKLTYEGERDLLKRHLLQSNG